MAETLVNFLELPINGGAVNTDQDIDTTNGNKIIFANPLLIFIHNTDAVNSLDVDITSNVNVEGKVATVSVNIAADSYASFGPFDGDFSKGGHLIISYNSGSGTSTTGKINPVTYVGV